MLFKGLSRVFSNTTVQKHQFFGAQLSFFMVQLSHPYMTTGKTIALTRWTFVGKVMSLLLNVLSRFSFMVCVFWGFPGSLNGKESPFSAADLGSLPVSGRSPEEGHCNPLQYSCLENPRDARAWWAAVSGVAQSDTTEAT